MKLIVVAVMLAVFFLVTALLSGGGKRRDEREQRLREIRGGEGKKPGETEKNSPLKAYREKLKQKQKEKLRNQQLAESAGPKKKQGVVDRMLQSVGVPLTAFQFTLVKLVLALAFFFLFMKLAPLLKQDPFMNVLIAAGGMGIGFILPGRWLTGKVKKKEEVLRNALPDMMDLLVVSVEAGLGFDSALLRLYEKDKGPLMQEMMRAIQDVQRGMSKKEAYGNVSERCNVKEIRSFLNSLIQAEQLGISIKSVLKTQSEQLREDRRQRAEEKALKAPVTMLIPLVIFIFPVIFIVLMGPAAMNIIELFG